MKWVVAIACVDQDFQSNPLEFLSNGAGRMQPTWAVGIVEAADQNQAYLFSEMAFFKGQLGQHPNDCLANNYVMPLSEGCSLPPDVTIHSYTRDEVAEYYATPDEPMTAADSVEPSVCQLCGALEERWRYTYGASADGESPTEVA